MNEPRSTNVPRNEHRDRWWPSPAQDLGQVVALREPLETVLGASLSDIQIAYESWGDPTSDEVVLIIHPLTSDCHVSRDDDSLPPGWWEELVGPGRAIDTERCFVVCPNHVGGCYGSTGPRFPADDGEPYGDRFPLLTPRDLMRCGRLFLEAIGVSRASLVIGPSMGGMVAWEWALEGSDFVDRVAIVAAPLATTPLQIGWNWLQHMGIALDLDGTEIVSKKGQGVARGVGMLSYRSPEGLVEKFGRTWFQPPGKTLAERGLFNVESWLRLHGRRIAKRYDPLTYSLFSRAMDLHDVAEGRDSIKAALAAVSCEVLVIGISSDQLYPHDQVRLGAAALQDAGGRVTFETVESPHGHDAFLLETEQIGSILSRFLK